MTCRPFLDAIVVTCAHSAIPVAPLYARSASVSPRRVHEFPFFVDVAERSEFLWVFPPPKPSQRPH